MLKDITRWDFYFLLLFAGFMYLKITRKCFFSVSLPKLWENLDKFLLLVLVVYFSLIGWHAVFHIDTSSPFEQKFMDAMLDNQKLVIGALLGLITGRALATRTDAPVPQQAPPEETPKPSL